MARYDCWFAYALNSALLVCLSLIAGPVKGQRSGYARVGDYPFQMDNCGKSSMTNPTKQLNSTLNQTFFNDIFPWFVYIESKGDNQYVQYCGGAIINELWILTAAHCVNGAAEIKVLVGTQSEYKAIQVHIHHEWYSSAFVSNNDIALLRLNQTLDSSINGICLPRENMTNEHKEVAYFSEWGYDNSTANKSRINIVKYEISEGGSCNPLEICAFSPSNMACIRPESSPLIQYENDRAVIIGILMMTIIPRECKTVPSLTYFNRVSQYIQWINTTIIENSVMPESTITRVKASSFKYEDMSLLIFAVVFVIICFIVIIMTIIFIRSANNNMSRRNLSQNIPQLKPFTPSMAKKYSKIDIDYAYKDRSVR